MNKLLGTSGNLIKLSVNVGIFLVNNMPNTITTIIKILEENFS